MNVPENLKYADTHEWVRLDGETATVGITDHAQAELTDIVYAELPKIGRRVAAREAIAVVESVKAASDIYSPIGGTVSAINPALEANPALLNTDPFGDGWLYQLTAENATDLDALKDAAAYRAQIGA